MKPTLMQIVLVMAILNTAAFVMTVIVSKLLWAWFAGHT